MIRGPENLRVRTPEQMTFSEGNPRRCEQRCEPIQQTFYWRAFTKISLDKFSQNRYISSVPSLVSLAKQQFDDGPFLVDTKDTDIPGALWTSHDPEFAMSMGLMRAVTEDQSVYLLGVNYCPHQEEQGVLAYKAVGAGRENRVLYPLEHTNMDRRGFTHGTIFNRFSPQQVEEGVLYKFDENFVAAVRRVYAAYPYIGKYNLHNFTSLINTALYNISFGIGVHEQFTNTNHLSELYLAFLQPANVAALPTRDVSSVSSVIKDEIEIDFLQRMFIETMIEERLKEKGKEAQRVVYFGLGAAPKHRQIEDAFLEAKKRRETCSIPNSEMERAEEDARAMLDVMNRFSGFSPGETPFADFEERHRKK